MSTEKPRRFANINPLSVTALRLELRGYGNAFLGTATGFIVKLSESYFLVSNHHVFSGKNGETGQPFKKSGAVPETVIVHYYSPGRRLGNFRMGVHHILDADGAPLWLSHPDFGHRFDVAALPIDPPGIATIAPLDLSLKDTDIIVETTMPVYVIGFPFDWSVQGTAIWKSGTIASEYELDVKKDEPTFLVDAATRSSNSGSLVVARPAGGYVTSDGTASLNYGPNPLKWLGVYSGRIRPRPRYRFGGSGSEVKLVPIVESIAAIEDSESSELGKVWRAEAVVDFMTRIASDSPKTYVPPDNRPPIVKPNLP